MVMSSQGQIERLINAAQELVAQDARSATDRDVLLACFGWLAYKLERRQKNSRPVLLTVGTLGAVAGGAIAAFGRALGWF